MEWTPIVDCAYDASITVGTVTESGTVTVALKDFAGNALKNINRVTAYISSDVDGLTTSTVSSATIVTGIQNSIEATKSYEFISETDGTFSTTLDGTGANSRYLQVCLANGKVVASPIVTFTN